MMKGVTDSDAVESSFQPADAWKRGVITRRDAAHTRAPRLAAAGCAAL